MSTNCLVTKLKGTVQNDNLLKLEEFSVYIDAKSGTVDYSKRALQLINKSTTKSAEARIVGGVFTDSNGNPLTGEAATKATIAANTTATLYASNNNCRVFVGSKFVFSNVSAAINSGNLYYTNFDELNYLGNDADVVNVSINLSNTKNYGLLKNITKEVSSINTGGSTVLDVTGWKFGNNFTLIVPKNGAIGTLSLATSSNVSSINRIEAENCPELVFNLSELSNKSISRIRLGGTQTIGALSNVYATGTPTDISFFDTAVTGSVETFVETYWSTKNKRSGTVTFRCANSQITFGQNPAPVLSNLSFEFSNNGVIVKNWSTGSQLASYDGTTWAYAN